MVLISMTSLYLCGKAVLNEGADRGPEMVPSKAGMQPTNSPPPKCLNVFED